VQLPQTLDCRWWCNHRCAVVGGSPTRGHQLIRLRSKNASAKFSATDRNNSLARASEFRLAVLAMAESVEIHHTADPAGDLK
jgi:hypothetical protein